MEHDGAIATKWSLIRLVVPFGFDRKGCTVQAERWQEAPYSSQRLFDHIQGLIGSANQKAAIGQRYSLTQASRVQIKLPNNVSRPVQFQLKQKLRDHHSANVVAPEFLEFCQIFIEDIELFLFETDVGFLVYQINFPENADANRIIEAMYYCKRSYDKDYRLVWEKSVGKNLPPEIVETHFADITATLLSPLGVSTYFESRLSNGQVLGYQALGFSALLLDKTMNDFPEPERKQLLGELMFKLRRVFKSSYKPSHSEFDMDNHPEILRVFENSCWGLSLEGVSNLIYEVDDDTTNHFFQHTYRDNVKTTYFFLYLLALHQRYALIHLNIKATQIDKNLMDNNTISKVMDLMQEISYFALRSYYSQVTDNTHQAKLYWRILALLDVEQLMKEVQSSLNMLTSIIQIYETKNKEKQQQKDDEFKNWVTIMTIIFVGISTLADFWGIYNNFQRNEFGALTDFRLWGGSGLILAIILWIGYKFTWRIKNR